MNKELWIVIVPALSWLLFALGGTQLSDKVKGWKGWRRFILPVVLGICLFFSGVRWWQSLLVVAIASAAFHLGYGIKTTWKMKALVGFAYACISLPIGVSLWNCFTLGAFMILFILSNTQATANIFVWKICEGFFGLFVGIELSYLMAGQGVKW